VRDDRALECRPPAERALGSQNTVIQHPRRTPTVYCVADGSSEAARYSVSAFRDMDPEVYSSDPCPADMLI